MLLGAGVIRFVLAAVSCLRDPGEWGIRVEHSSRVSGYSEANAAGMSGFFRLT